MLQVVRDCPKGQNWGKLVRVLVPFGTRAIRMQLYFPLGVLVLE
jgi:hypothetical protein